MSLSLSEGKKLVRLARDSIKTYFEDEELEVPENLDKKRGIFVTLKRYPQETLKGCIGFTKPRPLGEGMKNAARSAAFEDPRFPPLREKEFKNITIEISVLTKPQEAKIDSEEDLDKIEIGEDGLIVRMGHISGLLLPQVAEEEEWNKKQFVGHTCVKAGLGTNAWKDSKVKIYKFQAQIFKEEEPGGKIVKK